MVKALTLFLSIAVIPYSVQSFSVGRKLSVLDEFRDYSTNFLTDATTKTHTVLPPPSFQRDWNPSNSFIKSTASQRHDDLPHYPRIPSTITSYPKPPQDGTQEGHEDCEYYHNTDGDPEEEVEKGDEDDFFMLSEHEYAKDSHPKPHHNKSSYSSMPDFGHSPDFSHYVDPFHAHDVEMALNPAWPTAHDEPIKGSIDYVLIPMILIGIFVPIFTVVYVILGGIIVKLQPINLQRSFPQNQISDYSLIQILDGLNRYLDISDHETL